MKTLLATALTVGLMAPAAFADTYPVLEKYRAVAEEALALDQNFQTQQDVQALAFKTRDLVTYGQEILDLYAQKNPKCAEQLNQFKNELPFLESQSLEELHDRYHDGKGLPEAPRHCYFGRSEVIHPIMNLVRLKNGDFSQEVREEMTHEYEEVIEHLPRIQNFLDNPPN